MRPPQPGAESEVRPEAAGATRQVGDTSQPAAVAAASAAILRAAPENAAAQSGPGRQGPQSPSQDYNAWQWADDFPGDEQPGHETVPGHRQDGAPHPHAARPQEPAKAQRAPQSAQQDEWQWADDLLANGQQANAPQPAPARPQAPPRPPRAQAPRQHRQDGQQHPQPPQSGLRRMHGSAPAPRGHDNTARQAPKTPASRSRELVVREPQPFAPRAPRSSAVARRPGDSLDPRNVFDEAFESVKKAAYAAGMFSLLANILMLGGPLFMLQVYDRVLPSGNIRTLLMLFLLLVVLYAAHGLLDLLRGQTLNRMAGRIDSQLGPATLEALPKHRLATGRGVADEPLRDLAALRQFISGSGPAAFFDLPWAPLFLLAATLMHWALGVVTLVGMLVMVGIAVWNEVATKSLILEARKATERATRLAVESGRNLEACVSMGMMDPIVMRWQMAQQKADAANRQAGDRAAAFTSAAKTFRMFMQSVLLAVGALLVIKQQISSGTMIAVAVIGGQALGPIGNSVSQWRSLVNARDAFTRLRTFLKRYPVEPRRISPPAPKGRIEARNIQVTPPGAQFPALRDVSFSLEAGDALGIIGASAAGKSTLARVLVGLWPPERGFVLLDGVDMRMWNRDELGPKIGYLPQTIELFDGTVAQNISRFYPDATPDRVFRAAERVGAHQMIVDLPGGYNFRVGENGSHLSAGQRQRIGLARAVYGDPVLVVLDEPNANLDGIGEAALHRALRALKAARATVILVTHRTSALDAVDHILVLEKGQMRAFGEKAKVLQALTRSAGQPPKAAAAQPLTALPGNEAKQGA
jgi:PrtD family type I secretion system ABC transporter